MNISADAKINIRNFKFLFIIIYSTSSKDPLLLSHSMVNTKRRKNSANLSPAIEKLLDEKLDSRYNFVATSVKYQAQKDRQAYHSHSTSSTKKFCEEFLKNESRPHDASINPT